MITVDVHDLLARALPDDLPLAPAEPLLQRGRRARRIRQYRTAALASVLAVALAGAVALTAMARPSGTTGPGHPRPGISCTSVTPESTAGKPDCPPPKPSPDDQP